MSLAPGTRIGAYEIAASLGAGGMGEVYRARDLRLKRDVALKILPAVFAADPERIARFQREAEVLGALNHPLIAHVYGVEEAQVDGGGTYRAIVMELIEGEDLAARLTHGALAIDDAIPIARQIAEALEAAHEQGIVHRDLKPANIKVRPDGTIKVLDFGLAKALEGSVAAAGSAPGNLNILNSPTITSPAMTLQGTILGTAAYMSPEQAKGRPADKRSDLWAFGCVLYEMLTGRRPFDGEDVSDTMALVLKGSPDWTALPSRLPPAVRHLLERCLERDRRLRVASASTVLYALSERSLGESEVKAAVGDPAAVAAAVSSAVASTRRQLMRSRVMPIGAVAVLALALAAFLATRQPAAPAPPVARVSVAFPGAPPTGRGGISISRDGQQIAYVSNFRLFVRRMADYEAKEITAPPSRVGTTEATFSEDGRFLAFYSADGMHRVALTGGAPTPVCRVDPPLGIAWSAAGLFVGQGAKGIARCADTGGVAETIVSVEEGLQASGPRLLPDGKTLIYSLARTADGRSRWDKAQIVAETIGAGNRRVLITGGSDARYVSTGHLLYALEGVVLAVPFDATRLEVTGQAMPVLEGVRRTMTGVTGNAQFDVSSAGTLVYLPGPARVSRERVIAIAGRQSGVTFLTPNPGPYEHVRASRDGARLVIGSGESDGGIVWVLALDGRSPMQRLPLKGRNVAPMWSPDGRQLAVQSDVEADRAIFVVRDDGTGLERLSKPAAGEIHTPESWAPDGRVISFSAERNGRFELRTVDVRTKVASAFAGVESEEPINSAFSPDGKWLAYTIGVRGAVQTTTRGVYVQPFPATGVTYPLPRLALDFQPMWTHDGREIVWVPSATSGHQAVASVSYGKGLAFSVPTTFAARVTSQQLSGQFRGFDILPDGRIVGAIDPAEGEAAAGAGDIRVVLNWFAELEQKAPVGR